MSDKTFNAQAMVDIATKRRQYLIRQDIQDAAERGERHFEFGIRFFLSDLDFLIPLGFRVTTKCDVAGRNFVTVTW